MKISTAFMFGVAFLCAAIAAFLVRGMIVRGAAPGAVHDSRQVAKIIVVAAQDLKPGEPLTPEKLREISWAADELPKGAFTSKGALIKPGDNKVLAAYVAENEPIVAAKLYDPRESALTGRIKDGMSIITIRVNESSGVGGFAQPEDRVDVLLTQTERDGSGTKAFAVTLLRNVRVLAMDQQTQRRQQAQPPKTVTLEASPEDVKKLTLAQAIGQLSLALTKGSGGADEGTLIDINDLLRRQPAPPQPPSVTRAVIEVDPIVGVTRSTDRKEYKVLGETHH
jgi:pilus assembly protein CpaB